MNANQSLKEHARQTGLDLTRSTFTVATRKSIPYSIIKDLLELCIKRIGKQCVFADIAGEGKYSNHWHIRLSIALDKKEKKQLQLCIEYLIAKRFSSYYKTEDIEDPKTRKKFKHLVSFDIHHFDSYIEHEGHNFIKHLVKL